MNISKLKSATLGRLSLVAVLVLLTLACLPVATHADSLTLDGAPIDSFSFNTSLKTFSVEMGSADALPYLTDIRLGNEIPTLILDEFALVDGTLTLENELELRADFVKSYQYVSGSNMLTSDVTFTYGDVKATQITSGSGSGSDGSAGGSDDSGSGSGSSGSGSDGSGSGSGSNTITPEPAEWMMLASALLGLLGLKFFAQRYRTSGAECTQRYA